MTSREPTALQSLRLEAGSRMHLLLAEGVALSNVALRISLIALLHEQFAARSVARTKCAA